MAKQGDNTAKLEARIKMLEKDMTKRTLHNNKQLVLSKTNQDKIEARVAQLEKKMK